MICIIDDFSKPVNIDSRGYILTQYCSCYRYKYYSVHCKTGKDYHTDGCSSPRKSKIAIILAKAVEEGSKPHEQCGVPILK